MFIFNNNCHKFDLYSMGKKLIIFKDKKLFNILDEIKENFEFELVLCEKEIELEKLENDNLTDYLVLTKKKLSNFEKQILIDKFPININELNQTLNINFLKSKFIEQSKIDLGRYNLDLNSRILNQNEKELELTEKESSMLIFLKQSKEHVKIYQLQEKVWGYNSELETHTVETHVYRLRKKINDKFKDNEFIKSDKKGYFLNEEKK
tara:strand:- start:220 stop:840 length:621 start_codon:yes stop_codon:yes gene_type:complete